MSSLGIFRLSLIFSGEEAAATGAEYVIARDAKPGGDLVSHQDRLLLRSLREEVRERFDRFREKMDDVTRHLSDEDLVNDVGLAIAEARAERRMGQPTRTR